jgi:hypothetical protein
MKSWQVFNYALHVLPRNSVAKIWGLRHGEEKENRMAYYWAANPKDARSQVNPIDRLAQLIEEFHLAAYGHVARAAIDIMAKPLGGRFEYLPNHKSDKGTVDGEAVDVTLAVSNLIQACRKSKEDGKVDQEERERILECLRQAHREIGHLIDVTVTDDAGKRGTP